MKKFFILLLVLAMQLCNTGMIVGKQKPKTASPALGENTSSGYLLKSKNPVLQSVMLTGNVFLDAGNRLIATQNGDGGWGWSLSGPSATNTIGPIGMGLAHAYQLTNDAVQHTALSNAGAFLLAKTNNFSPTDGFLAAKLDQILGGTTYRDFVKTNFYDKLAAGTYNRNGAGTLYTTAAYIQLIRNSRTGVIANLAAWDIGTGLVGAAACGASTSDWITGVEAEINELDPGTVGAANYYDVLGLAGAIYGLAYVHVDFDPTAGAHASATSLSDLADILAGYQINNGGFTWNANYVSSGNETNQETAYAILALNEVNRFKYLANIKGAADYLKSVELGTGGWDNYVGDPDGENNELTGEALWGYSVAYSIHNSTQNVFYTSIQTAETNAVAGNTILVYANSYGETVTVDKSLTITGTNTPTTTKFILSANPVTISGFDSATLIEVTSGGDIQNAVDGTPPGGTVEVTAGTYPHLDITKPLTLNGNGAFVTHASPAITVNSDNVTINGFAFSYAAADYAIQINANYTNIQIHNCNFNTPNAVDNQGTGTVDATNNYWGFSGNFNGPTIASNPSGTGGVITIAPGGIVTYDPWVGKVVSPSNSATGVSISLSSINWNWVNFFGPNFVFQLDHNGVAGSDVNTTVATNSYTLPSSLLYNTTYHWYVRSVADPLNTWIGPFNLTTSNVPDPTLTSPTNYAVGITILPTFAWSSVAGATSYRLQISTSNTFGTLAVDSIGLTGTSATLNYGQRLHNGTIYYWRVLAIQGANTSSGATRFTFTTVTAAVPVISASTVMGNSVLLTWYPSPWTSGLKYDIFYSINSDMSAAITVSDLIDTYYTVSGLNPGTTYYLLIAAKTPSGTLISYSSKISFTTAGLPVPHPSWPILGATDYSTTPTAYWYLGAYYAGLQYEVRYAINSSVDGSGMLNDASAANLALTSNLYAAFPALTAGATYYWQVRSYDGVSTYSSWSSLASFTVYSSTPASAPRPYLSWPVGGATSYINPPTLYWYLGTYATGLYFNVEWSTDNFATVAGSAGPFADNLYYTFGSTLSAGTYYWRVNSQIGIAGTPSSWSTTETFVIPAASGGTAMVPVPSYPIGGATIYTLAPTLSWYAYSTASLEYQINYSPYPDVDGSGVLNNPTLVTLPTAVTWQSASTVSLSGLTAGVTYYWQVRSRVVGTPGSESSWSTVTSFTTAAGASAVVPLVVSPNYGQPVQNSSAVLTWTVPTQSQSHLQYDLQLSKNADMSNPVETTGINNSQYQLTNLQSGNYYWRVVSKTDNGTKSLYSSVGNFKVNGLTDVNEEQVIPTEFSLSQNYPNPFNPTTIITFALPKTAFVTLKVYDMLGREVKTLMSQEKDAGTYSIDWNADNNLGFKVASGMYVYRITAGNFVSTKKMVLIK